MLFVADILSPFIMDMLCEFGYFVMNIGWSSGSTTQHDDGICHSLN
jgi:hypothetical protein